MNRRCICGCGKKRGLHKHHVVYQQELRRAAGTDIARAMRLAADPRNVVLMGFACHAAHHNASRRLQTRLLPDSVFEFAGEILGPGLAYEYLRHRYAGEDPRLDALLVRYGEDDSVHDDGNRHAAGGDRPPT